MIYNYSGVQLKSHIATEMKVSQSRSKVHDVNKYIKTYIVLYWVYLDIWFNKIFKINVYYISFDIKALLTFKEKQQD